MSQDLHHDLNENYRVYGHRLGFGQRPALLLIDFVAGYFDPDCDLFADVDAELASALRLRELARAAQIPIVYTCLDYDHDGINGGVFFKKAPVLKNLVRGNAGAEWAPGLKPGADEIVIAKQYPSAFFGTTLAPTLHTLGIDNVIITGLTTSGCIRASCVDAMSHGFITVVVADACGDRHEDPHRANLFDMNAKYADVVTEQETADYLRSFDTS